MNKYFNISTPEYKININSFNFMYFLIYVIFIKLEFYIKSYILILINSKVNYSTVKGLLTKYIDNIFKILVQIL